ncbi:MAG: c-type cytochrome [Hyphomicrobiaceae bacterium]
MKVEITARQVLIWLATGAAIALVAGVLFAWSGLYNVAASSGHLAVTRAFLEFGMSSSVRTQSLGVSTRPLDDELAALGAGHFAAGCAPCHGSPADRANPIVRAMLPEPPNLVPRVGDWKDRELFWIVKHGIKYAGMPAWVSQNRDDEVWALVAFLRKLPLADTGTYERQTRRPDTDSGRAPEGILRHGVGTTALSACARCHDDATRTPVSAHVPHLGGQSERYLLRALTDYASGSRESGIMQPVAAELSKSNMARLASYYASLPPATATRTDEDAAGASAALERGTSLALEGRPDRAVPACITCHGDSASPSYPRLTGLSPIYLAKQLRLWRSGLRSETAHGKMMAAIARRLDEKDIDAVARYFGTRSRSVRPSAASAVDRPRGEP